MYIVLGVEECSDVPVLCKRAYDNVLRDGVCDVRTRRKLEPSEIPTQANMPDLLALVTDKRVIQYLERTGCLGLIAEVVGEQSVSGDDGFDQQLGDLR